MKKTVLNEIHKQLGARMVEFGGWEMPVLYTGVIAEHKAVREKAGLFDVSHMGEIEISGPEALEITQKATCNDVAKLKDGDCQYSAFLTEQGTFVDDIIVNRIDQNRFLICVNASNADKDFEWVRRLATSGTKIENVSDDYFQIAIQGPEAEKIVAAAYPQTTLPSKPFTFVQTTLSGGPVLIARTGYTGEDGFEIYGKPEKAATVWKLLMEQGAVPCGLGARDTLRLEAALPLYGHEIDDKTNPYEAGLAWIVKMDKGNFIGRDALLKIAEKEPAKSLVGLEMREPGIARQGCKIYSENSMGVSGGEQDLHLTGTVVSGTKSPTLDRAIALGYVERKFSPLGTKIWIDIHNKKREAVIVPKPFYKRKRVVKK
jgi:aminomethyltransferase